MAVSVRNTPLKSFRLALGNGRNKVSQEKIARQADISLQTYWGAERGEEIHLSTAVSIWKAMNAERKARGLKQVSFEQLWAL